MQLFRYMVYIWEDYEKEMEKKQKGITKTKDFKYPPILPIVYYEGSEQWTAVRNFKDRIFFDRAFEPFTPKFFYKLVQLNKYSVEELVDKNDELSLVMLINRMQNAKEFRKLNLPKDYLKNLSEHSTDELLGIIGRVIEVMLRHINVPEEEVVEFTEQVKEKKMGQLFECFEEYDVQATRREAKEEGKELFLINKVCNKLAKGKSIPQIADELEEDTFKIEKICQIIKSFDSEYSDEDVLTLLKEQK